MSYVVREAIVGTLSTLGAKTFYSSGSFNGMVQSIYVLASGAVVASGSLVITGENSSTPILTVTSPSTVGVRYYPRASIVGTTANAISSSGGGVALVPLSGERLKCVAASSSGLSADTWTVQLIVGG